MLHALRVRPFAQRWLLALMLLLPLAQGAAWLHIAVARHRRWRMPPSMKAARAWSRTCAICASRSAIWRAVRPARGLPMLVQASASVQLVGQPPAAVSAALLWRQGAQGSPGADAMSAALLS